MRATVGVARCFGVVVFVAVSIAAVIRMIRGIGVNGLGGVIRVHACELAVEVTAVVLGLVGVHTLIGAIEVAATGLFLKAAFFAIDGAAAFILGLVADGQVAIGDALFFSRRNAGITGRCAGFFSTGIRAFACGLAGAVEVAAADGLAAG